MTTTDTDRLAAEGAELAIAGHTFHVKYTARALKDMEARFGSVVEVGQALARLGQPAARQVSPEAIDAIVTRYALKEISADELAQQVAALARLEEPVPLFGTVYYMLALGLRHERVDVSHIDSPDKAQFVDEDWVLDHGEPRAVAEYARIAFEALVEALPAVATEERPTTPLGTTASNGSPGGRSSGSPSVGSGSRPRSSGTRPPSPR